MGEDEAEDIVVDAFLYFWERHCSRETGHSNPPAYILTTIKHKCLNSLRSKRIKANVEKKLLTHADRVDDIRISTLEALDPDEIFSDKVREVVRNAIDSLPERTRKIFIMCRVEDRSYKEIADSLSISTRSVEYELIKASHLLRAILKSSPLYVSALIAISLITIR